MRVGLNVLYLLPGVVGGTETYAAGLLAGLANTNRKDEFVVFTNREAADWPIPSAPNITRVVCPVNAVSRVRRYWFEQVRLSKLLREHRIDVLHSLGYVSPLMTRYPTVVTVPDLNFIALGRQMRLPRRIGLGIVVSLSILRSRRVITFSNFSRQSILSAYHLRPHKLALTYLAPRMIEQQFTEPQARETLRQLSLEKPYIVAFCSVSPHKNIERLIEAYQLARHKYAVPHRLVLIGHLPSGGLGLQLPSDTQCTGYLPDPQVRAVLSQADLLAFPSRYEGFGLPVLEAMELGTPVISSHAASLPEVAGEAASLFDPIDIQDMAEKIAEVALNPAEQERLRRKGYENYLRFSWDETARRTTAVYHEVLAGARR